MFFVENMLFVTKIRHKICSSSQNTFFVTKYTSRHKIHFSSQNTFFVTKYTSRHKIHFSSQNTFQVAKYVFGHKNTFLVTKIRFWSQNSFLVTKYVFGHEIRFSRGFFKRIMTFMEVSEVNCGISDFTALVLKRLAINSIFISKLKRSTHILSKISPYPSRATRAILPAADDLWGKLQLTKRTSRDGPALYICQIISGCFQIC